MKTRCSWPGDDPLYIAYHDSEWGVPVHDDRQLFEFLTLETFQAGLSWITVLRKREHFRKAFDDFDYLKIAKYSQAKQDELREDAGIIRNRLKIAAAVNNAQRFIEIQEEFGSFDSYIWGFVDFEPLDTACESSKDVPNTTEISDRLSKDLKKRGFKFVGSTVIYAHMQATGMVNDHVKSCFRYKELWQE